MESQSSLPPDARACTSAELLALLESMREEIRGLQGRVAELEHHIRVRSRQPGSDQAGADSPLAKMKIYVLWHEDSRLRAVPDRPYLRKVNLSTLALGDFQDNQLAENRLFLCDLPADSEYIGFASARWNQKYAHTVRLENFHLMEPHLRPDVVFVAHKSVYPWAHHSDTVHPGMMALLKELEEVSGFSLYAGETFWANNFICHFKVYQEFIQAWRPAFFHFYRKYKPRLPFSTGADRDPGRHDAYFYERLSMIYFANRRDLTIKVLDKNVYEV